MALCELTGRLDNSPAYYKELCKHYAEQAEQSAENAENSATSAEQHAETATDKATEASNSADLAREWAIKTDGLVDDTDYSAKQYALNAEDSATIASGKADDASASATLAEKWATYTNGTVDGNEYSAKKYAQDASNSATTATNKATEASNYAQTATNKASEAGGYAQTASDKAGIATTQAGLAGGSALSASNSATLAEKWATKTDGTVDGTNYSAKKYAENAQTFATNAGTSEINAGNSATLAEKWATLMGDTVDGNDYSAKYYANEADGYATSASNSASSAQSNADYIQTEATKIDTTEKRVSNIEKLLQGNLYDYQTDSTSAYTKTVPAGAMPYASLDSVGGKTLVFNQLQANTITRTTNGVVFTFDSTDGSLTISEETQGATRSSTAYWLNSSVNPIYWEWINGHKYLIAFGSTPISNTWYIAGGSSIFLNAESQIVTMTETRTSGLQIQIKPSEDISTPLKYRPQVFDLTLMYGSGNEPSTVAEFQQMFSASYYSYNAGTLLSAGITEVVSQGKNLADYSGGAGVPSNTAFANTTKRIFEVGKYVVGLSNNNYYNPDFITALSVSENSITLTTDRVPYGVGIPFDCVGGTQYACSISAPNYYGIAWYSEDGTYLSWSAISNVTSGTATAPSGARQGVFILRPLVRDVSNTYANIQLEYGTTASTYVPAKAPISYPIPAEIQALEGYGWSAGGVYNYIDYEAKKFVQNVGSRAYASGDESDSTVITDMTTTYYPLNPAIETDISAYLTDDNLIEVEPNGTLTFENQNGDDYRIPVPSAETYMIDLQSALGE